MTKRFLIMCALLATTSLAPCAFAAAAAEPEAVSDNRMKLLPYDESDVYTITTRYGYQTNVVFGRGEEILTISVGDRSLWQLIPAGNRLFIRPMADGVTTNMTILTNKHSYQFDLKSLAEGKSAGNIYVARFVYPEDEPHHMTPMPMTMTPPPSAPVSTPAPVPQPAPESEAPHAMPSAPATPIRHITPMAGTLMNAGLRPEHPNFNYTYAGPDDLAPLEAYDDGKSTFVEYTHMNSPAPHAFIVAPDGQETPVDSRVDEHTLIVDAVAAEIALEGPQGAIHIYNETLNPKLGDGTNR